MSRNDDSVLTYLLIVSILGLLWLYTPGPAGDTARRWVTEAIARLSR